MLKRQIHVDVDSLHLDPMLTRRMVLRNSHFLWLDMGGSKLQPWFCRRRVEGKYSSGRTYRGVWHSVGDYILLVGKAIVVGSACINRIPAVCLTPAGSLGGSKAP